MFERERDAALFEIDGLDANFDNVAFFDHAAGAVDVLFAHLGDVQQTLDAVFQLYESPEAGQACDGARDDRIDLVALLESVPGILAECLEAEREFAFLRSTARTETRSDSPSVITSLG